MEIGREIGMGRKNERRNGSRRGDGSELKDDNGMGSEGERGNRNSKAAGEGSVQGTDKERENSM